MEKYLSLKNTRANGVFLNATPEFLNELAKDLSDQKVLEVFAGNGYLAAQLQQRGVDVFPTTRFSGMDAHSEGLYCDVKEMSAIDAVMEYGLDYDVLLMSWPTVTEDAYIAAKFFGKPIVFIGEYTDYAAGLLGGCATDKFWAHAQVSHRYSRYAGRGLATREFAGRLRMLSAPRPEFMLAMDAWTRNRGYY